jgi:hypothetical protein
MVIDLENNWLRKDNATSSSTVYYGYSQDPSASTSDNVWAIRKITASGSDETVSWNDNKIFQFNSIWDDRFETFIAPTSSLNITYSVYTNINSFDIISSIINLSWDYITGVNQYEVLITDQNGITYDSLGNFFSNNYVTTKLTNVQQGNTYQFKGVPNMTYSVTINAVNMAGSTNSNVYIIT